MTVAFVERHRGHVPLNFDEGGFNVRRFATRAWDCGERVRYPTIFPKSLIRYLMTGDGIVANRGVNSVTLQRGVSESLRICLQSSYSRLCGGS